MGKERRIKDLRLVVGGSDLEDVAGELRRHLAEAEWRLQRRGIIVRHGRIIVETLLPFLGAVGSLEIVTQRLIGIGQLLRMMGEDAVIIVDRAQKGRELALQRGDVEAGAQVPEQAGAKFLGRGAGTGEADKRIAALDRAGGERSEKRGVG